MKKIIFFVILAVVISASLCCGPVSFRDCEDYGKAYELTSGGLKDSAQLLSNLNKFLSDNPTCIYAYLRRGDLYYELDSLWKAKADYLAMIRLVPSNTYALYKVAMIYLLKNVTDSADFFLNKAIETKKNGGFVVDLPGKNTFHSSDNPNFDVPYIELIYAQGMILHSQQKYPSAIVRFSECIEQSYNLSGSYFFRGICRLELKQNKVGCQDIRHAAQLGDSEAQNYLAKYCK